MTNHEHIILSVVASTLGVAINKRYMEIVNGTLFIKDFSDDEAYRVLNNLTYNDRFGKVIMSRVGSEVAYDFA